MSLSGRECSQISSTISKTPSDEIRSRRGPGHGPAPGPALSSVPSPATWIDSTSHVSQHSSFVGRLAAALQLTIDLNLWVALCSGALTLLASRAVGVEPTLQAFAVVFFAALGIYNCDHLWDPRVDRPGAHWRRLRVVLIATALVALVILLGDASWTAQLGVAGGAMACLAYGIPWPRRRRPIPPSLRSSDSSSARDVPDEENSRLFPFRLKRVPGFKGVFVAAAVTGGTFFVPIALTGSSAQSGGAPAIVAAIAVFLLAFGNTQLFDVRDLERDRAARVPTLPARLGRVCITGWVRVLALSVAIAIGVLPTTWVAPVFLPLVVGALVLWWAGRIAVMNSSSAPYFELLTDGMLLAMGVCAW